MLSTWSFPTKIVFGASSSEPLAEVAKSLGMKRPLVVTDPGIVKSGLLDGVTASLARAKIPWQLFDRVEANPTEASVFPGVSAFSQANCDGVIAVGGGSALDAAKAIRLKTTHPLPLEEYDDLRGGAEKISSNLPPMIAIATTSGTGSEVGRSAVSPYLIPSVALADPSLTLRLPPHLTAATGMDAMTHNLEAYLAAGIHPMCDAIGLKGVEICRRYLPRAVSNGGDLEARSQMMVAAIMGGVAFQKGLGTVHSLAHPLSTVAGMHHGLTNAILLPHVMRFNLPAVPERFPDLALALGIIAPGHSCEELALRAISAIEQLNHEIGIPPRLRDAGVREEMIPVMVPLAMQDGCRLLNPRPTSAEEMEMLYRAAF